MKKLLSSLCAASLMLGVSQAAIVLNETFTYPDGSLIAVSSGLWTTHSGTAGQVDVASGKVNLTQAESEDVSAPLTGRPYSSGNLYASFSINLSTLPAGAGGYFAHLKDDGTAIFKARVFVSTNGTDGTKFRVGVANGGNTPVLIPADLSLGQNYFLVIRYNTESPATTLWINPATEAATADRADATDSTSPVGITTFALRQSTANGSGMGILTLDDLKVGTAFGDVVTGGDPSLNPPSIGNIPNQSIPAGASTADIPFVIGDGETPAASLTLTAGSDNPGLVPPGNVSFGGSESNRTVKVTAAAGQQGAATITVTVTDGNNNTAARTFRVVVGAPAISAIPNQITPKDTITPPIAFTVSDAEGDILEVTAVSTNEAVVPSVNIIIDGTGNNRTMTIIPAAAVAGITRITLVASDGFNSASNSFILTVYSTRGVDFADAFDYPDGSIMTNSSFTWTAHSGSTGQTQVAQGKLQLSSTQTEDINAFLTNSPYAPSGGWILFASFTVNFSARPSSAGDYFAHFRSTGNAFGGRVFATTSGAATGRLRLGVANNSGTPSAILPVDLDTNVTYTVVTRLNVGMGQATLWVNPASEDDASVTATDNPSPFDVWTFAFRQSGGIGTLAVDDLKIGTSFTDVSEIRYRLTIAHTSGGGVRVSWPVAARTAGYRLQANADLNSTAWTDVTALAVEEGGNLSVTFSSPTGNRFFRLVK